MTELAYGVAGSILEKLGSVAYNELGLARDVKKDLKKLKEKTLELQSVLNDAEKKQTRDKQIKMWVVRVKEVFDDAVDVLDEFDCQILRRQVVKEFGSVGRKVCRFFSTSNPIAFRFSIAHKVKEIRERLDEITQEMSQFQLISSQLNTHEEHRFLSSQETRDRMTHSFVPASDVIGRESDKTRVLDMLMREGEFEDEDGLSVIAIVGIGGLGKTTLAKSVFNEEKLCPWFDLKLWVCVSLDFDVIRLVREILKEADSGIDVSKMSMDQLQTSLRRILEGKRFLLVLDDVWNEERLKWLELRELLNGGAKGSRVIVTTRTTLVSSVMTTRPPHQLGVLHEEESLSLFFKCAFGDEKQACQHSRLKDIGKEIVKKCGGVPLALKTLGSLLYSKDEAEWIRVRDNEIWEIEREHGRILPALRLSYNTMPPHLKRCFAYCSVFPQDAIMERFDLVSIWMALGILQSPNEEIELENFGESQFKELCARAFFQRTSYDEDPRFFRHYSYVCMHDLIHDLACSITESECFIMNSGKGNVCCDSVRHLRMSLKEDDFRWLRQFRKLRSIYIDQNESGCNIEEFFLSIPKEKLRYLRVFDLGGSCIQVLPSSIGKLKHLRYLNLSFNDYIKRLPDSICELQSLQTLLLEGCERLEELPRGIRKLVSLTTLSVTTMQNYFPKNEIRCLKSLRTLSIMFCRNLRSLGDDEDFRELSLKRLRICEAPKITDFPLWLKGASNTLQVLEIAWCSKLIKFPEWLPNFASLETLVIISCYKLLSLPKGMHRMRSLTSLGIMDCINLNLDSDSNEVAELSLQHFQIDMLRKLRKLPEWLRGASHTLQTLTIKRCRSLDALPEWLTDFTSLNTIKISYCGEFSSLPEGMARLTSLKALIIEEASDEFYETYNPQTGKDWLARIPNVEFRRCK